MTWASRATTGTARGPSKKKTMIVMITRKGCLGDEIGIMIGECT